MADTAAGDRFTDATVIVTGSTRGIGADVARGLRDRECRGGGLRLLG